MLTFSWLLVLLSVILFTFYPQIFAQPAIESVIKEYLVPPGSHPHDVAPASNGSVWYTAQHLGELGLLDPISGKTQHIALGQGLHPMG